MVVILIGEWARRAGQLWGCFALISCASTAALQPAAPHHPSLPPTRYAGTNDLGAVARGTPPGVESALAAAAPGVARRVQQAVQLAKERLPAAEVVLLGVLPRGTGSGEGKLPAGREAYRWPSVYAQAIGSVNAQLRCGQAAGWPLLAALRCCALVLHHSPAHDLALCAPPAAARSSSRRGWAQGQSRVHFIDCGSAFLAANGRSISPSLMPDALHPGAAGMAALAACAGPLIGGLL